MGDSEGPSEADWTTLRDASRGSLLGFNFSLLDAFVRLAIDKFSALEERLGLLEEAWDRERAKPKIDVSSVVAEERSSVNVPEVADRISGVEQMLRGLEDKVNGSMESSRSVLKFVQSLRDTVQATDKRVAKVETVVPQVSTFEGVAEGLRKRLEALEASSEKSRSEFGERMKEAERNVQALGQSHRTFSKSTDERFKALGRINRLELDLQAERDFQQGMAALLQLNVEDIARATKMESDARLDSVLATPPFQKVLSLMTEGRESLHAQVLRECGSAEGFLESFARISRDVASLETRLAEMLPRSQFEDHTRREMEAGLMGESRIDVRKIEEDLRGLMSLTGEMEQVREDVLSVRRQVGGKVDARALEPKADRDYVDVKIKRLRQELSTRLDKVSVDSIDNVHKLAASFQPFIDEKVDRAELRRVEALLERELAAAKELSRDTKGAAARFRCLSCNRMSDGVYLVGPDVPRDLDSYGIAVGAPTEEATVRPLVAGEFPPRPGSSPAGSRPGSRARPLSPLPSGENSPSRKALVGSDGKMYRGATAPRSPLPSIPHEGKT